MHQHSKSLVRSIIAVVSAVAAIVGASGPASAGGHSRGEHCIAPWGEDLNHKFDTSARIVTSFFDCPPVYSGRQWTVPLPMWGMRTTFETVPAGFVPAGDTPLEDFRNKFAGTVYVIDPGTRSEQRIFRHAARGLWIDAGPDSVVVTAVDELHPLRPGHHIVEVYWIIVGTHCDGGANQIDQCLTGPTLNAIEEFDVVPPHNRHQ